MQNSWATDRGNARRAIRLVAFLVAIAVVGGCSVRDPAPTASESEELVAAFDATPPLEGPYPLEVQFNDLSSGSPSEWFWTFGDSEDTTARSPRHVYWTAGEKAVSLTVRRGSSTDTERKTRFIDVRAPYLDEVSFSACVDPDDPHRWSFESSIDGDWTELEWSLGSQTFVRRSPVLTHNFGVSQSGVVHVTLTARYLGFLEVESSVRAICLPGAPRACDPGEANRCE